MLQLARINARSYRAGAQRICSVASLGKQSSRDGVPKSTRMEPARRDVARVQPPSNKLLAHNQEYRHAWQHPGNPDGRRRSRLPARGNGVSPPDISAGRRLGARDVAGRRARSGWPAVRRAWIYIYLINDRLRDPTNAEQRATNACMQDATAACVSLCDCDRKRCSRWLPSSIAEKTSVIFSIKKY